MTSELTKTNFKDREAISIIIEKRFRGNTKFYKEMVCLFFETIKETLDDIQQVIVSNDVDKLKFSAHYIKGGAYNLGAERIGQISEKMELLNSAELPVQIEKLLDELEIELKIFRESVDQI